MDAISFHPFISNTSNLSLHDSRNLTLAVKESLRSFFFFEKEKIIAVFGSSGRRVDIDSDME